MTTCREIVRRSLLRARIVASGETPSSQDAADALATLNDMMAQWPTMGITAPYETLALSDTFRFCVPAASLTGQTVDALALQGTWDADTNDQALASSVGVDGYVYRVTVAGSTTLDSVTDWSVGDYAIYDAVASVWVKGRDSRALERAVIDILALRLCDEFGREPTQVLMRDAMLGDRLIRAKFFVPGRAQYDTGLLRTPSRGMIQLL